LGQFLVQLVSDGDLARHIHMDIIPTDLATYGKEAQSLLDDLQSRKLKGWQPRLKSMSQGV